MLITFRSLWRFDFAEVWRLRRCGNNFTWRQCISIEWAACVTVIEMRYGKKRGEIDDERWRDTEFYDEVE